MKNYLTLFPTATVGQKAYNFDGPRICGRARSMCLRYQRFLPPLGITARCGPFAGLVDLDAGEGLENASTGLM